MKDITNYISSSIVESCDYMDEYDNTVLIGKLTNALAEEIYAWYGYFIVCPFLSGNTQRKDIQKFYTDAANDELNDHAHWLIERINQLGGSTSAIASPENLVIAQHKYEVPVFSRDGKIDIISSLKLNIKNERNAIETYKDLVEYTSSIDPASNSKLKEILMDEEEHLNELQEFLDDMTRGAIDAIDYDDTYPSVPDEWDGFDDPLLSM